MKKVWLAVLLTAVIVGAGAFYGGMKYGQSKAPAAQNFAGQIAGFNRSGNNGGTRAAGLSNRNAANFLNGEIIAKDDKSMTIKLRDGGSKIVFFSDKTEISKFNSGSPSDLQIGQNVSVNGTSNTDGSVTAQTVQLRPAMPVNQPVNPPVTP